MGFMELLSFINRVHRSPDFGALVISAASCTADCHDLPFCRLPVFIRASLTVVYEEKESWLVT